MTKPFLLFPSPGLGVGDSPAVRSRRHSIWLRLNVDKERQITSLRGPSMLSLALDRGREYATQWWRKESDQVLYPQARSEPHARGVEKARSEEPVDGIDID